MPKKVKYRKQQRGRMTGKAWRGSTLAFGDFGLKVLEPGWITDHWVAVVKPGKILFEMEGVALAEATEAMRLASHKLALRTTLVKRETAH